MTYKTEDLDNIDKFRLFLTIPYNNLAGFVFEYLKKKSFIMIIFWLSCSIFLLISIFIRIRIAGIYQWKEIFYHSITGFFILPLICIPIHEFLHIVPYFLSGAKNIRIGMDLKQFLFYVSAHRYVASPWQFKLVAIMPFLVISLIVFMLILVLPAIWKWSLSVFLFAHATMCAGDFALLNLYFSNNDKEIYTWDDVDKKEAYFYEKL